MYYLSCPMKVESLLECIVLFLFFLGLWVGWGGTSSSSSSLRALGRGGSKRSRSSDSSAEVTVSVMLMPSILASICTSSVEHGSRTVSPLSSLMRMFRVAESASGIINPAETQGGRSSKEARKCEGKNTLRLTRTGRPSLEVTVTLPEEFLAKNAKMEELR